MSATCDAMVRQSLRQRRSPRSLRASYLAIVAVCHVCLSEASFYLLQNIPCRHWRQKHPDRRSTAVSDASYSINDNDIYNRELFSVAPMMGHTNQHFHNYFRLMSQNTHLYTEMVPSSQVVRAYKRARQIYLKSDCNDNEIHVEEILEVVRRIKEDPAREYQTRHDKERQDHFSTLDQLVGTCSDGPIVLQLGGRDPTTLGAAAVIGAAFGDYASVNLNCGCPSNAVGGRSGGCALMKEPDTVARCVKAMNEKTIALSHASDSRICAPTITVKHRLGVRNAATFDAAADRAKDDSEAYNDCSSFVRTVSLGGNVSKFHVHARLGLLGEFADEDDNGNNSSRQSLWVPREDTKTGGVRKQAAPERTKVDHKREQERAKRRARKATIQNRHVPPLRPHVVNQLADAFPELEFVSNGGIQSLSDVERIVDEGLLGRQDNRILGSMVGRSAINHPCSFAAADVLWEKRVVNGDSESKPHLSSEARRPTRVAVLQDYIRYCDREEERIMLMGASEGTMDVLRRRLIAVPFHHFTGEEGSDDFQRRLKKLKNKTDKVKASSILSGAMSFVPSSTLDKCVDYYTQWEDVAKYEFGLRRGSAMQRIVY